MRIDLEELPVPNAVETQGFFVVVQNCNRLGVFLGVVDGESLIRDGDTGDQLEFVLQSARPGVKTLRRVACRSQTLS